MEQHQTVVFLEPEVIPGQQDRLWSCRFDKLSFQLCRRLDYLPSRYYSWLQESNRDVILAKRKGQVVSFHLLLHSMVESCSSVVRVFSSQARGPGFDSRSGQGEILDPETAMDTLRASEPHYCQPQALQPTDVRRIFLELRVLHTVLPGRMIIQGWVSVQPLWMWTSYCSEG
eukprot:gi/632985506/ref/XP_007909720.1/ PREDICTED: putative N-acetyltransferase 16 [Callorhinchus milii]